MQQNVHKSVQNYPKTISLRNFEIPPKIWDFGVFQKENSMCRGSTKACVHYLDSQYNNFWYAFFLLSKIGHAYVNFRISPCAKWCFSQASTPLVVYNSPRNKNMKEWFILHLLEKMVFLTSRTLLSPSGTRIFFPSTLNVMISQMVENECLGFDQHVDIQVSYKIKQFEKYQRMFQFYTINLAFNWGSFEVVLTNIAPCPWGIKN
jgi:hypothetical protein